MTITTPEAQRTEFAFSTSPEGIDPPSDDSSLAASSSEALEAAVAGAMERIAPAWPLDRFIAVNPLWGQTHRPLREVAEELSALSGARMLMPRSWYRDELSAGRIKRSHLEKALERSPHRRSLDIESLLDWIQQPEQRGPRRARVVDVADSFRDLHHQASWRHYTTTQVSQFCASYFDNGQSTLRAERTGGLFASWRRLIVSDRGPAFLMGNKGFKAAALTLPAKPQALLGTALRDLGVAPAHRETYLAGLLLDLGGWSAWCMYLRFTAQQRGEVDDTIRDLLGILVGWEWLLLKSGGESTALRWKHAMDRWNSVDRGAKDGSQEAWIVQRAVEIAWQDDVEKRLFEAGETVRATSVSVQAAFCIDVRSEVFRRALEAESEGIQTLGFAGFFGLPAEYLPAGASEGRPQLPGPLSPALRVTDAGLGDGQGNGRLERLFGQSSWKTLRKGAVSTFLFVEALGLCYAPRLIRDTFRRKRRYNVDEAGLSASGRSLRKPRLTEAVDGQTMTVDQRADLAAGMLRAMSLTSGFGRLVLLAGHGSQTRNNPHAAGLDCGACCGQTGEVNARATAALLNESEVREGLRARGIEVPKETRFLAGLHNTTTDEVDLFDLDELPDSHRQDLAALKAALTGAGATARRERAARLGLSPDANDRKLLKQTQQRTGDWAQVRPEWGLADNAGFIVAPRERTRHMSLAGQSFLHDYRAEEDEGYGILELIMTAPMVVTHWINFQYYASTVDNQRYGSGNKVLHNVVGAHIGVFEGNGGDLRTGLSLQSLHDGERWIHTPRRLSVYIEAPREAIDAVLDKHDHVRALVEGGWLYLLQLEPSEKAIYARTNGGWEKR